MCDVRSTMYIVIPPAIKPKKKNNALDATKDDAAIRMYTIVCLMYIKILHVDVNK